MRRGSCQGDNNLDTVLPVNGQHAMLARQEKAAAAPQNGASRAHSPQIKRVDTGNGGEKRPIVERLLIAGDLTAQCVIQLTIVLLLGVELA